MINATKKIYYEDVYLITCKTRIVSIGDDYIETESTVAYPEGGGQESDNGFISTAMGIVMHFVDVAKTPVSQVYGSDQGVSSVPESEPGDVIRHKLDPDDICKLVDLRPGMEVVISIDVNRRARLSLSHSASHLLYVAVGSVRKNILDNVIGCHIKTDGARFDFMTDKRFTSDELEIVQEIANDLVRRDLPVRLYEKDPTSYLRYWECDGHTIPCGGTHVSRTGLIGELTVKRRGVGKNKERLFCVFPESKPEINKYHE